MLITTKDVTTNMRAIEIMTKDFEGWAKKNHLDVTKYKRKRDGEMCYYSVITEGAWLGWQGASTVKEKKNV